MKQLVAITGLAIVALLPLGATADEFIVGQPGSLKWGAAPPALPKGAQMAILFGDPAKEGQFVYRLKVPAGTKVPAHTHPNDENVTVLSGTFHIGTGDKLDETKGEALKAGGYMHMPKGVQHYAWFSEDTIITGRQASLTSIRLTTREKPTEVLEAPGPAPPAP
jgi:quercetin dioxygenase-like cupin family protein